jgi:hypothetical protein
MAGIAVILGAGGSFDCAQPGMAGVNMDWRPPLVHQLFESRFTKILRKYQKVAAIQPSIQDRIDVNNENLEAVLKRLAAAPQLPIRRQFQEVPLYLQELIGEVGMHFTSGMGTRYDTLVSLIEQSSFDSALYITVNYDRLLDTALARLYDQQFNSTDDYCPSDRRWALFKLHGSVDWGKRVLNGRIRDGYWVDLDAGESDPKLASEITVLGNHQQRQKDSIEFYYPALSVPIGGKEDFGCPPAHVDELKRRLQKCSHVLVIGFSCLDTHVVNLLRGLPSLKHMLIVNGDAEPNGRSAFNRLRTVTSNFVADEVIVPTGFGAAMRGGDIPDFCSGVPRG